MSWLGWQRALKDWAEVWQRERTCDWRQGSGGSDDLGMAVAMKGEGARWRDGEMVTNSSSN